MRLVCWNLCRGTDTKWAALCELRPDVAVLAEVAQSPRALAATLFGPEVHWHWVGANPAKGLAVATFDRPSVPVPAERTGRWSVAARVGAMSVVGIWSCPADGGGIAAYSREVVRGLECHVRPPAGPAGPHRSDRPLVVAGDFNVEGRGAAPRQLFGRLRELGLRSAYHEHFGEPLGAETRATYFHQRDRARPFHIDFCFLSPELARRVERVEVGHYDDWIGCGRSDHVPLIVDLAD